MDLFEENQIILLSKISYNNVWYQICSDKKGNRFYLKIENNKLNNITLKEYLELDKIFNKKFDGKYYNKKSFKKNSYMIIVLGLELITLSTIAFKYNRYSLEKNNPYINATIEYEMTTNEKVSKEEILTYIDKEYDLEEILSNNSNIDDKYKPYIRLYVQEYSDEDLTLFYYNLNNLTIKTLSEEEIKKYTNNQLAVAYFDSLNHTIVFSDDMVLSENLDTIYHEFRHATKFASVEVDGRCLYNSFNVTDDNIIMGTAILEGMNSKYTSPTYYEQQNYVDMLFLILSEEKMKNIETNGDVSDIINELSNITGTNDDATKLIMLMDEELTAKEANIIFSKESKIEIRERLIKYFFVNEQRKLLESNEFNYQIKYCEYIDNCDNFQILLQKKYLSLEGNNEFNYTELDKQKIKDENEIQESITNTFNEYKKIYSESFMEKYDLTYDEANEFSEWILIETESRSDNNFNIDNKNFKVVYNTPISYIDVDGTTKILYMYQIYIRKSYLLNGMEEEITQYINYNDYINALESFNCIKY